MSLENLISTLREAYQYAEEHPDETALFALISPHRLKEAADALEQRWISVNGYKELPSGEWLVLLEGDRREVASSRGTNGSVWVIGGIFGFDQRKVVAYTTLPPLPGREE